MGPDICSDNQVLYNFLWKYCELAIYLTLLCIAFDKNVPSRIEILVRNSPDTKKYDYSTGSKNEVYIRLKSYCLEFLFVNWIELIKLTSMCS